MKTFFNLTLVAFAIFFFRVPIGKLAIDEILDGHTPEIAFVGTLAPVYCQIESVQEGFVHNVSDFKSFASSLSRITENELPNLRRSIENIVPYNEKSRNIKESLVKLYSSCDEGTRRLNQVVKSYQNADDLFDYVVFGYQAYRFVGDVNRLKSEIERNKAGFEMAVLDCQLSLYNELGEKLEENKFFVLAYDKIYSRKDQAELKDYLTHELISRAQKEGDINSTCNAQQVLKIKNQLFKE